MHELPAELQYLLSGATWQEIFVGQSEHRVIRVTRPRQPACYLKIATRASQKELLAEKERLHWLQGRLPVPHIYHYSTDSTHTYLLISEIPGFMSLDSAFEQGMPTLIRLLAQGLQQIHDIDITHCPFDHRLVHKIGQARERVAMGLVDEADFDQQRQDIPASLLFQTLIESQPTDEDLVFTHGDYCLPNIFIDHIHTRISGFIDLGHAGVADRYQDLALAARSLAYNFGPGYEPLLWEAYGLKTVDRDKIEFYQLLDEFF